MLIRKLLDLDARGVLAQYGAVSGSLLCLNLRKIVEINQLSQAINSMSPEQLQTFASEARLRYGVNKLCGLPIREHLLAAAEHLVNERLIDLGLRPRPKRQPRREPVVHTIDRRERQRGRNGPTRIIKVGVEVVEKLWGLK